MNPGARRLAIAAVLVVNACDRQPQPRANDTTAIAPSPPETTATVTPPPVEPAWDTAAGPVFIVMGASGTRGAVIRPDIDSTASLDTLAFPPGPERSLTFEVFHGAKLLTKASVADRVALDTPQDCSAWPTVRLTGVADSSAWSVAFAEGRFSPIVAESIAALSRPDSVRLARDLARVASAVPGDTTDALRGLPYVVRRAWLFGLPTGGQAVIAEVGRSLNQEANPVHEQLLLVAERDSATARLQVSHASRTVGGEEGLETVDLLAVGLWRGREHPVALLARYIADGVIYGLLTRRVGGTWAMTWASPYVGC